jgi:ligand-binding SRPBCC domain-containing protein
MPKIHELYREQVIATNLKTAWDFISSPQNLDTITPDDLDFEIVTEVPATMYNGLLIEYRVGVPFMGKQTWLTELKHIREQHSFVDEQRIGPYQLWYHYHEITEVADGIRFVDRVNYVLPFGPFGALAHQIFVKRQLKTIFDYRDSAMLRVLLGE